jgi:hypothetical protein
MFEVIQQFNERKLASGDFSNHHNNFEILTMAKRELREETRNIPKPFQ